MFAGGEFEVETVEDFRAVQGVGEVDVAVVDAALGFGQGFAVRGVGDGGGFVEDVGDAFGRGEGFGEAARVFGVFAHGAHAVFEVADEDEEVAGADGAGDDLACALPEDEGSGAGDEEVGGAFEAGGEAFGTEVGVHGAAVAAAELAAEVLFEGERLDGADGVHAFGGGRGQAAFAFAGAAAGFVDEAAAAPRAVPHDGQWQEGDEGELPVDDDHDAEHAQQDEDVGQHGQEGADGDFFELVDVVDEAQGEVAGAHFLVVGERELQELVV